MRQTCLFCGGAAEAPDGHDVAISCPACSARMTKEDVDGLVLDVCGGCAGTWYDAGELDEMLSRPSQDDLPSGATEAAGGVVQFEMRQTRPEYRKCPRCDAMMARRNFEQLSGVIVDKCVRHGVFLETGELERIRAFVNSGGCDLARQHRDAEDKRVEQQNKSLQTQMKNLEHKPVRRWGYRGEGAMELGDLLADFFRLL